MLTIENTDSGAALGRWTTCTRQLAFQKLLQIRSTCRSNKKTFFWEKSNEAYPLSIRAQTTKPHFDLFLPGMNVKENVFFLQSSSSKRHCVTQWCEQRGMNSYQPWQNCGKIVTFLCLGISIITWVIILKQLLASGSWILVNIHFA